MATAAARATPTASATTPSVEVAEAFGEKVLRAKSGDYQVQLKPVGEAIDISLIKSATPNSQGFSSGAASNAADFQAQILKQVGDHPELWKLLSDVLIVAASDSQPPGIVLGASHKFAAKSLLSALK